MHHNNAYLVVLQQKMLFKYFTAPKTHLATFLSSGYFVSLPERILQALAVLAGARCLHEARSLPLVLPRKFDTQQRDRGE